LTLDEMVSQPFRRPAFDLVRPNALLDAESAS
jgi:hypothetical protein